MILKKAASIVQNNATQQLYIAILIHAILL